MANVPIRIEQGGTEMKIGDGGTLTVESGGSIVAGGSGSITVPNGTITFAKQLAFISNEQTADGMAQDIAHGLGVDPAAVLVVPSSNAGLMDAEFDIAYVTDETNVTVTATNGLTYYVMAWG